MKRRRFLNMTAAATVAANLPRSILGQEASEHQPSGKWSPQYMLSSCMYGYQSIETIMPEVVETGASAIDIWPKAHGDQREQLDAMGEEKFANLLQQHDVSLGCITQYKLGPFGLKDEMRLATRLGCSTIVTGAKGPRGSKRQEPKKSHWGIHRKDETAS